MAIQRCAVMTLLLAVSWASPAPAADRKTWKTGGATFELSASDFKAWTGDTAAPPALSIAALLAAEKKTFDGYVQELVKELEGPEPPQWGDSTMTGSVAFEVLSVVGTLVTFRERGDSNAPGAAHPTRYAVLHVRDLARQDVKPSLLDYVSEKQLVQALKADPWVRKFANTERDLAVAATLSELIEALNPATAQQNTPDDCAFDVSFTSELVHQFFFHHVAKDKVAARIAIPAGSEFCNRASGGQEIGLLLPMPERLRDDLLKADRGEAGFLAGNRKGVGSTVFSENWEVDVRTLVKKR